MLYCRVWWVAAARIVRGRSSGLKGACGVGFADRGIRGRSARFVYVAATLERLSNFLCKQGDFESFLLLWLP